MRCLNWAAPALIGLFLGVLSTEAAKRAHDHRLACEPGASKAPPAIYVQTDTVLLKIEPVDDDVQVIVEKNGKLIEVLDKRNGSKVTLHSGEYKGEERKGIKLDKEGIHLLRNGVAVVTIRKVKEAVAAGPKDATDGPKISPDKAEMLVANSIGMKLAPVAAGKFTMGASADDLDRFKGQIWAAEGPQHQVKITKAFAIGIHPVTVGQFRQFIKASSHQPESGDKWQNPGFDQTDDHPVVHVTWNDAVAFCAWLSKKEGRKFRLPSEAEWEYACRAGTQTAFFFGDDINPLAQYAWYGGNAERKTHPVGQLKPNAWGLYDMHGNVWQWTSDWYDPDYYKNSPLADPAGPANASGRDNPTKVLRGGSLFVEAGSCRSASRKDRTPEYSTMHSGFRVVSER